MGPLGQSCLDKQRGQPQEADEVGSLLEVEVQDEEAVLGAEDSVDGVQHRQREDRRYHYPKLRLEELLCILLGKLRG